MRSLTVKQRARRVLLRTVDRFRNPRNWTKGTERKLDEQADDGLKLCAIGSINFESSREAGGAYTTEYAYIRDEARQATRQAMRELFDEGKLPAMFGFDVIAMNDASDDLWGSRWSHLRAMRTVFERAAEIEARK